MTLTRIIGALLLLLALGVALPLVLMHVGGGSRGLTRIETGIVSTP